MADPVSGSPIADASRVRLDGPDLHTDAGVGHVPHLEIPDEIAARIVTRPAPIAPGQVGLRARAG